MKTWIIRNQLNRRNQTPEQTSYYRGKLYEQMKKAHGGTGANQFMQSGNNFHSAKTDKTIASQYGVTDKTIRNDAAYAAAVDALVQIKKPGGKPGFLFPSYFDQNHGGGRRLVFR